MMLTGKDIEETLKSLGASKKAKLRFESEIGEEIREIKNILTENETGKFDLVARYGNLYIKEKCKNIDECFEVVYRVSEEITHFPKCLFIYYLSILKANDIRGQKIVSLEVSDEESASRIERIKPKMLAYSYPKVAKINIRY